MPPGAQVRAPDLGSLGRCNTVGASSRVTPPPISAGPLSRTSTEPAGGPRSAVAGRPVAGQLEVIDPGVIRKAEAVAAHPSPDTNGVVGDVLLVDVALAGQEGGRHRVK